LRENQLTDYKGVAELGTWFQYPGHRKYDARRLSVIFEALIMIETQSDRFPPAAFRQFGGSQGRKKGIKRKHPRSSNRDLQQKVFEEANYALADYGNGNQHRFRIVHAAFRVVGPIG
jgi:hypothetical protein